MVCPPRPHKESNKGNDTKNEESEHHRDNKQFVSYDFQEAFHRKYLLVYGQGVGVYGF